MGGIIHRVLVGGLLCFALSSQGQIKFSLSQSGRTVAQAGEPIHVSTSISDGNSYFAVVKKGAQKRFPLEIPKGYTLSSHFSVENNRYLVFAYQYDVSDSGGSQFLIIDKQTLNLVHREVVGSFNIGEPLIYNDVVFISAAGYTAEFEIASGKKNWIKSNLFGRPYYFDGLLEGDVIEVEGDLIRFGPNFTVNRRTQQIVVENGNQ